MELETFVESFSLSRPGGFLEEETSELRGVRGARREGILHGDGTVDER